MTGEQAKAFLNYFLTNMDAEVSITKKVIGAVPQDQCEYKPDPKSMSARELAWHIVGADTFFIDAILAGKFEMTGEPPNAPATISEILKWHETTYADRVAKLKALTPDQLTKPIPFFNIVEMPAVMFLGIMLMHMSHHRGQLSVYLRPMGSKVPSIYGGSADEPFQMPANA